MEDFYVVLGVAQNASPPTIKRSFRRRAKELHPDTAKIEADASMRLLLDAYEVLSDPERRAEYDRGHLAQFGKLDFNYREFLRSRTDDFVSQAKLILYDLLHSHDDDALETYQRLVPGEFLLEHYLSHGDFMDCSFLLAEAFDRRGDFIQSCELYKKVYFWERRKPYFHHFIAEVIDRLRQLTCFKMVAAMPPEIPIRYIREMIEIDFSRKDSAFFHKKIAEIYSTIGEQGAAIRHLRKGLELDAKLSGVKKLKDKIGFSDETSDAACTPGLV